ncbi:MAG: 2OG-Fe(II) oxygenase [Acidimicrobiales bacterium]
MQGLLGEIDVRARAGFIGANTLVIPNAVPVDVCAAAKASYNPEATLGGERAWITPDSHPALVTALVPVLRELCVEYRTPEYVHCAFLIRLHRGDGLREHFDNEYEAVSVDGGEPQPRVVFSVVYYLSDPTDYVGGSLVADGMTVRPERGTAIVFRGDDVHRVEPVTAGVRYIAKLAVCSPATFVGRSTTFDEIAIARHR